MLSHNQSKLITSLSLKKYRQKYRKFLVEGDKMVEELFNQPKIAITAIYGTERWKQENGHRLKPLLDKFNLVEEYELKKVTTLTTPPAVIAVAELPEYDTDLPDLTQTLCLYLDGIQDPGNMGTILRICDWFGIGTVFCSPECADVFSPKVVQSTMGAIFRVKTIEMEWKTLVGIAQNAPLMGAVLGGNDIFTATLPKQGILIIGNEGRGIRPEVEASLTHRLTIPRHPNGRAESLNAAVATGILVAMIGR